MQDSIERSERRSRAGRAALALALVVSFAGCLGGGGSGLSKPRETRDEGGFTISETSRIGLGARSDFEKALRAMEEGDLPRAIALLESVTEAEPGLAAAWIDLGMAHRLAGDLESAERALLMAIERNPRHPVAQNELGIVYRRTGRFEQARTAYEAALDLHPSFHHARLNLGILCDLYLADSACALEQYERYLQAAPGDETVEMWVADLSNRIGRAGE